jgi:hypothetical protein
MKPDRKPRKDSKLDAMPESRQMELRDKLLANEGHEEILGWLAVECGVSVVASALTSFYRRHCAPLIRERRQLSAVKAEVIVDDAGRTDWNAATMELVKQVSFEIMSGQAIDHETAEKFIKLILKADAQAQTRDKAKDLSKDKAEAGIDALAAEAKGNKEAEAALAAYVKAMRRKTA